MAWVSASESCGWGGMALNAVAADNAPTAKSERTQAGQYASDTATTTKVRIKANNRKIWTAFIYSLSNDSA